MNPITKLSPDDIAIAIECRTNNERWHVIAKDLGVRTTYLQSAVKRAEKYGFAAFKNLNTARESTALAKVG